MAVKEVIFLEGNLKAYVCDEYYDIIEKSLDYDPLRWVKRRLQRYLKDIVRPGVIDMNMWNTFVSIWKKYSVHLSYGFYDPYNNYVFLNLQALGIKATTDCKVYTKPNSSTYQFVSEILAHELIHYVFQNNIVKIYSFIRQILLNYYNSFWAQLLDENIAYQVAGINFNIGIDMNINTIDKQMAIAARTNMNRFISILNKLSDSIYVKDSKLFDEVVNVIINVISGQSYRISNELENIFKMSYINIYNDYPRNLLFGQELVYSSEVLATASSVKNAQALNVVRRLLDNLEV